MPCSWKRHSPEPYQCVGCGGQTICRYDIGGPPLCPECVGTLQERPELKRLLLAHAPGKPRDPAPT